MRSEKPARVRFISLCVDVRFIPSHLLAADLVGAVFALLKFSALIGTDNTGQRERSEGCGGDL